MGFLNWASKMGAKVWNSGKRAVGAVYHPISKIVGGIKRGEQFVDNLLDTAVKYGVPSGLVDVIRDDPIYQTIHGAIDFTDDIVNKDLPNLGRGIESVAGVVENFVKHGVNQLHAPAQSGNLVGGVRDVLGESENIRQKIGNVISGSVATGFTPNRDPSSRAFVPLGLTSGN